MIMKKVVLILALVLPMIFMACSGETKKPLVGVWVEDENSISVYEGQIKTFHNMIFNDDGTGGRWVSFPKEYGFEDKGWRTFNWVDENGHVTMYSGGEKKSFDYTITDGKLVIHDEGKTYIYVEKDKRTVDSLRNAGFFNQTNEDAINKEMELLKEVTDPSKYYDD